MELKLGIIGLSEGNGHPYSWSAIINGEYDKQYMAECGYAGIPLYLKANEATLGIPGARVTHIWTQDKELSDLVAKASCIKNVADNIEDMIGKVDAVLLARDDPEHHRKMAEPFIDANVPIFIDKPLCIDIEDLEYFKSKVEAGKLIMSCSSMRYSPELFSVKQSLANMGDIELINVTGKKDWVKYGVHMLEALCSFLDDAKIATVRHISQNELKNVVYVEFESGVMATVNLFQNICPTFQLSVFGTKDWKNIDILNSYAMFKENLIEFVKSVQEGGSRLDFSRTENIIRALIAAKDSLENEGERIRL